MFLRGLLIACLFFVMGFVYAQEIVLVSILSEPENNLIHELVLGTNDQDIATHIIRRSVENQDVFTIKDVNEKEVVIARASGRDAILISGRNTLDSSKGGKVYLRYLYNGITGSYNTLPMRIEKVDYVWTLLKEKGNDMITTLRIKPRYLLGQMIGIDIGVNE